MILDTDTRPERQIYHLGAVLLGTLAELEQPADLHLVYEHMNRNAQVSSGVFMLVLDWLYLLDAITEHQGGIRLCS